MSEDVSIENVLALLRKAVPQNARAVWDHKIIAVLSNTEAVQAIKDQIFAIESKYERETAQAWELIDAAQKRRKAKLDDLTSKIEPKPFDTRTLLERLNGASQ